MRSLPDVRFGQTDSEALPWRAQPDASLDDDEVQPQTEPSVVAALGFDPLDLGESARDAAPEYDKVEVGFEDPARGPHHCGECAHFRPPGACEEVRGAIAPEDWCRLYEERT